MSQPSQPNTFRSSLQHLPVAALALIVALLACFAVSTSAQNIVANPNFSPANGGVGYGPLTGWTQNPNPSTLAGFPSRTGSNSFGQRYRAPARERLVALFFPQQHLQGFRQARPPSKGA